MVINSIDVHVNIINHQVCFPSRVCSMYLLIFTHCVLECRFVINLSKTPLISVTCTSFCKPSSCSCSVVVFLLIQEQE